MKSAFSVSHPYKPPRPGSKIYRLWEISDEKSRTQGDTAPKDEVLAQYVLEGYDVTTGKTQYSKWLQNFRAANFQNRSLETGKEKQGMALKEAPAVFGNDVRNGYSPLTISPDGSIVLPQALLDAMMLDPDGRVTAHVEDGELRVISPLAAIRRMQRIAQKYKKPGVSVVDEFLAERRAMWGEE